MLEQISLPRNGTGVSATQSMDAKVAAINNLPGPLRYIDCPECRNKGFIAVRAGQAISYRECGCMPKRRVMRRMHESGLDSIIRDYTFASYRAAEPWQADMLTRAQQYAAEPKGWWYVCGTPGTGKTHLCTAICGALLKRGQDVRYMLWREDAPRLKALITDAEVYEAEMQTLKDVGVLYIDDFFKGSITEADKNLAFELLNARYNRRAITIISSERTIEDVLDIDEGLGSRIHERAAGNTFRTAGGNRRLGHA